MRRIVFKFLVIFWLVCGCFSFMACSGSKFVWCTSNGIFTYNRHTGQLELLWENSAKQLDVIHDTVFIERGDASEKP